jgi:hypothetical protein
VNSFSPVKLNLIQHISIQMLHCSFMANAKKLGIRVQNTVIISCDDTNVFWVWEAINFFYVYETEKVFQAEGHLAWPRVTADHLNGFIVLWVSKSSTSSFLELPVNCCVFLVLTLLKP